MVTMFIMTTIASIFLIAPAPLLGEMMKTMPGVSPGQVVMATMTVFNILVFVSAILGGPLLDKFGVAKVYMGGMILLTIGALLAPFISTSFWGMIFIRILQGAGTGPIMASVLPVAAIYFPPKQRSILIVIQGIATSIGIMVGRIIVPGIYQTTGNWQTALAWLALFSILGLVISFTVALKSGQGVRAPETIAAFMENIKLSLIRPVTWVVIGCLAMYNWMYQAFNTIIPSYAIAYSPAGLGYDPETIGSLASGAGLLLICGGIIGAIITEKFIKGNAQPVVMAGFVLAAIFIFLIKVPAIASNHKMLQISIYSMAFFSAFIQPQAFGYMAKYYPKGIAGTLGGLIVGISSIISLAGTAAVSVFIYTSRYQAAINFLVAVALLGAIIALFLKHVNEERDIGIGS